MYLDEALAKAVVEIKPHWYHAKSGPFPESIVVKGETYASFYTAQHLSPEDESFKEHAQEEIEKIVDQSDDIRRRAYLRSEVEAFKLRLVKDWFEEYDDSVDWIRLFNYAELLRYRTYENDPVTLNMIIAQGEYGREEDDITSDEEFQKILDPLGSSTHVYLRVDKQMRLLSYEQVGRDEIRYLGEYEKSPSFLLPVTSRLEQGEYSFHRTQRGDILINSTSGLLASWRKGNWYLYDTNLLKDTIVRALKLRGKLNVKIADHLLDIVFDLSYRRHGALLVYDQDETVRKEVSNPPALFSSPTSKMDVARRMLAEKLKGVKLNYSKRSMRLKSLLLEAASMDGALIFDRKGIHACGAMIKSNEKAGSHAGARTTAAHAAWAMGGIPIKISSDGDVTILFDSEERQAKLHFA